MFPLHRLGLGFLLPISALDRNPSLNRNPSPAVEISHNTMRLRQCSLAVLIYILRKYTQKLGHDPFISFYIALNANTNVSVKNIRDHCYPYL